MFLFRNLGWDPNLERNKEEENLSSNTILSMLQNKLIKKYSPKKPVRMKELISFRVITSKMMVSFSPPGWWCHRKFCLHLLFLLQLWVVFRLTSSACSFTFWERSLDSWHMWSHFLFSWLIDSSVESAHYFIGTRGAPL